MNVGAGAWPPPPPLVVSPLLVELAVGPPVVAPPMPPPLLDDEEDDEDEDDACPPDPPCPEEAVVGPLPGCGVDDPPQAESPITKLTTRPNRGRARRPRLFKSIFTRA
jgi:hypothetical protein